MRSLLVRSGLIVCAIVVVAGDQRKAKTHTITIECMRFQPEVLTVSPGDTIVWVNKDVPHTATSKTGGFDSKDIQVDKLGNTPSETRGTSLTSAHSTRR